MIAEDGEDTNGDVVKFFCSEDGYVYKMDKGTSFNGEVMEHRLSTAFYHYGSPRNWKEFYRSVFEITGDRGTQIFVRPVFDYDDSKFPETFWSNWYTIGTSSEWGSVNWGEFIWGTAAVGRIVYYMRGHGTNMSLEMRVASKYNTQHIIHNAVVDFSVEDRQI